MADNNRKRGPGDMVVGSSASAAGAAGGGDDNGDDGKRPNKLTRTDSGRFVVTLKVKKTKGKGTKLAADDVETEFVPNEPYDALGKIHLEKNRIPDVDSSDGSTKAVADSESSSDFSTGGIGGLSITGGDDAAENAATGAESSAIAGTGAESKADDHKPDADQDGNPKDSSSA